MDSEQLKKTEKLRITDEQVVELYQTVEVFLSNFGKQNVLYPTRAYTQIESEELRKLAQVFYSHFA